jgi:hypothetical protein
MTSQLQPLHVSITNPFTHLVRKDYDACLNEDNHILTPRGKTKSIRPCNSAVDIKRVERSASQYYSKIGFKLLLYGTEDDILWADSEQSGEVASSSENERATDGSF